MGTNLNLILSDDTNRKPQQVANIRGPKRIGTTDDDEGRRGNLRHDEDDEDGRLDIMDDEGLRDDRKAV